MEKRARIKRKHRNKRQKAFTYPLWEKKVDEQVSDVVSKQLLIHDKTLEEQSNDNKLGKFISVIWSIFFWSLFDILCSFSLSLYIYE